MNQTNDLSKRRTIRRYTDQPISADTLNAIIEDASHAPTTGNMQLYSVVVTRDPEMKKKLAPAHFGQPQVEGCDVLLTVCADYNRFVKWCEQRQAKPGYDNLQSLLTATLDATIFAQQIVTAAEQRGIGTCYLGTTTYNAPDIAKALELPKRVVPIATLSLGYPADEGQDCGRLPIEAVMHVEKYKDYTPEDIDRLYAEKEARDDSHQFVTENGKATLAQVFTDVRYTRSANEAFSEVLRDFLKEQWPFE
ncbi:MAG: nitroreductase family protein [Bacteroidales bacterium]|nr:nitroreductase family protein [Bacteroidales bacterium]